MSLINSISECNVFFNLMYNLNFKIMKIQKFIEANNEEFGWSEIENMISSYDVRRDVEDVLKEKPTTKISVKFQLEINLEY